VAFSVTVRTAGEIVEIVIEDASLDGTITVPCDRHLGFGMLAALANSLSELPGDPTAPLHLQQPCLRSKHPTFQVGLRNTGEIVLAIRPDPIPPFEFDFSVEGASELVAALRKALVTPAHSATTNQ
jgi:hypothetical protein